MTGTWRDEGSDAAEVICGAMDRLHHESKFVCHLLYELAGKLVDEPAERESIRPPAPPSVP